LGITESAVRNSSSMARSSASPCWNGFLEASDFGHQLLCLGFVLLGLGLPDLLGERVALLLGLVQPNDDVATTIVDGQ
jgi:hypothetical protein